MIDEQTSEQLDDYFEALLRKIIVGVHGRIGTDKVGTALFYLLGREANTWRSIRILRKHTPVEFHSCFMVDAGCLLRAMFDAYLQANFIVRNPSTQVELATQYLDFEHVERRKMEQKVLRHDNFVVTHLQSSLHKSDGEKKVAEEFDRVKDPFLLQRKRGDGATTPTTRTRDKWYESDLLTLAKAADKEAEYDTFMASFSGCVHSSTSAIKYGPLCPQDQVLFLASMFAARVARMNVEYMRIDIGSDQPILDEHCKGWLDKA